MKFLQFFTKQRLLFAAGVASAVAVEVLAKGPWAHAVWAPVLMMFFTDFEQVTGIKNVVPHLSERVKFLIGAGCAGLVEWLAGGHWAHVVWLPTILAMFTDLEKVVGGDPLASAPLTPAAAPPAVSSKPDDTVTPLDRPPSGPAGQAKSSGSSGPTK